MTQTACVILAAGKGTRMNSRTPKVLHRLAGRTMLEHVLASIEAVRPERVVLVTSHDLTSHLSEVNLTEPGFQSVVQEPQLGTAHAVMMAKEPLSAFDGDVLVLFGDTPLLSPETIEGLLAARRRGADTAVAVLGFRPTDPAEYGRLIVGADGTLERIVEFRDASAQERATNLCNAGLMAIDGRHLFSLLDAVSDSNAKGEYYLTDVVEIARGRGLECTHSEAPPEEVMGINDRCQLAEAEAIMQARLRRAVLESGATLVDPATTWLSADTRIGRDVVIGPNVVFGPGVTIEDDVEIKPFCHLEGVTVRSGAVIGPYARLRPGSEIGEAARVGNFVELKNTTLEPGAKANHLSYLGDSRVGEKANVGAGTITCNYDGYTKSRTDIGKGAFIGSNSALVAPVVIGDGAVIGAGSVITRDVQADSIAVARGSQEEKEGAAARRRARLGNGRGAS